MNKCKLSLLSAAVLMGLATSSANKKASASSGVNALHVSSPTSTRSGGHNARTPRPLFHGVGHGAGGDILYAQAGSWDSYGVTATNYASAASSSGWWDDEVADDFVVGSSGWTITGFNFDVYTLGGNCVGDNSAPVCNGELADVYVYPDAGGMPVSTPICASVQSTNNAIAGTASPGVAQITLNTPCVLIPGTYWVAVAFDNAPPVWTGTHLVKTIFNPGVINSEAMYRSTNPLSNCRDQWYTLGTCFGHSSYGPKNDLAYQVVGVEGTGIPGGDLALSLTVALDNGDPAQCGVETSLSVDVSDQVNFCYTVTNNTGHELDYQTLSDTLGGTFLSFVNQSLPDGGTLRYNRIVTADTSTNGNIVASLAAQDSVPGYNYDDTVAPRFVDITANGVQLGIPDFGSEDVLMPFSFSFYGTTTNTLSVGVNGGIYVGFPGATIPAYSYSVTLPTPTLSGPAILPAWENTTWAPSPGGVYVATLGAAPNRTFVIEWSNLTTEFGSNSSETATFEVIVDESTNTFSFEYPDMDCSGCSYYGGTTGVQMQPNVGTPYFYGLLHSGSSILWTPSTIANRYQATAIASLNVGTPVVAVTPDSLSATVDAGSTSTTTLSINNTGNRDLAWSIDQAPSAGSTRSHFPRMPYHPSLAAAGAPDLSAGLRARVKDTQVPIPSADSTALTSYSQVPAYAWGSAFYSFDAANPSVLTTIATTPPEYTGLSNVIGGSFAHSDLTTEYLTGYNPVSGGSSLATVDVATGLVTMINPSLPVLSGEILYGIRWDASTSTMYAFGAANTSSASGISSYIHTMNLTTGALTLVGQLDDVQLESAAFDQSGNMYGLDLYGDELLAIDKTNGGFQGIGPLGFDANYAQGIDFDPSTNTLWWAGYSYDKYSFTASSAMYTIDTNTGHATEIAPIASNEEYSGFAVAVAPSTCYASEDVPWLSVSPASGAVAAGEPGTSPSVTFDATDLAAGTYTANLCVHSNDTSRRLVPVPVTLTVPGGGGITDRLFEDGFDGSSGGGETAQTFVLDDGSYENVIGLNDGTTESPAIWLNRFTLSSGQYPLTLQDVQIEWPDADNGAGGDLAGLQARILVYYDADGNGDPSNAVKVYDGLFTIGSVDAFESYPIAASIPGAGDVYIGFEDAWAEGGASPGLFFPAAIDTSSVSHQDSWVSGSSSGEADINNLGNNDLTGVIDDLAGLPGNWLIRADGQTTTSAPVVLK